MNIIIISENFEGIEHRIKTELKTCEICGKELTLVLTIDGEEGFEVEKTYVCEKCEIGKTPKHITIIEHI